MNFTKPLLLFVFFASFFFCADAQDIIYRTKGDSIKCKVNEVGEDSISYNKITALKDRALFINKKDITRIRYENGYIEIYSVVQINGSSKSADPVVLPYDIIFTTTGDQFKVKVIEVDDVSVTYSLNGSKNIDKIDLKKVVGIRYSNGYEETYNATAEVKQAVLAAKTAADVAPVASNDLIKLKNGKEIKAKITEVDETSVHYTMQGAAKELILPFYDILKVAYANGYEETYASFKKPSEVVAEKELPKTRVKETKAEVAAAKKEAPAAEKPTVSPIVASFRIYTLAEIEKKRHYSAMDEASADPLKVEYLDLRSKGLKTFPPEIKNFTHLSAINLSQNNFKKIPVELFDLPELQYVWLDNIGLQSLKFDNNELEKIKRSKIVFLSVNGNKLTKIPSSILNLSYLQELRANNNQINSFSLEKGFEPQKSNLQIIDLQKNRIGEIPAELSDLPLLTKVNLAENNIKTIDKSYKGYKGLKSIKLNSNPIKKVDPGFYNSTAIEDLDLNQTLLTSLPDSISKLSRLRVLITPNTFSHFPADFGQLRLLYELHLNNSSGFNENRITGFPTVILNCARLNTLDISGANINTIPPEIAKLKRLENLYLNNCQITSLPEALFSLPNLKILDLSENKITRISGSVSELTSLDMLNLQNSPIEGNSLLSLRRALPLAQINYFDTDFGLNFVSKPLPANMMPGFKKLFEACDKGNPGAYYALGDFFKKNNDYGLALKAFRWVADDRALQGTGQSATCMLIIAEMYDDIENVKPYSSPYKRKRYSDYTDYTNTSANDKAYNMYIAISNIYPKDQTAQLVRKKARARLSIICNETADNLAKIFDFNNSEIERLIQGSGNMQNVSSAGTKIMNDAAVDGNQTAALIGGLASIFGKVSSQVKDDKAERYKNDNVQLKTRIARLRNEAAGLLAQQ